MSQVPAARPWSYDRTKLKQELLRDEGFRSSAYQDSEGYWTIGIGRMIDGRIGGGISEDEALYLLERDIGRAEAALDVIEPRWRTLDDDHQRVLVNLSFNLGAVRFVGFRRFWESTRSYLDTKNRMHLAEAADHLLDSKAARQTGERYHRLAERLAKPSAGG